MKKLLILILLFGMIACKQSKTDSINPNMQNTRTGKHINIPGTRLYMVPPPGFTAAKGFIGLQDGKNSMLNVMDIVGGDFNSNAATFSSSEFEKKGAKVYEYKELKVNGFPAKYIFMQGDANTNAYALVFGDTTFSTMIMASCPANDKVTNQEILKAINSIWYDKSIKIDPLATASFSLNDKDSKFRFSQYNANIYLYTIGGASTKEDKDAPAVIVTQFPNDNSMTLKSIADMMVGKLQEYGATNPEIKNVSVQLLNGADSYQMEVYTQMQGKNAMIYYCIVAKNEVAIIFEGVAKSDYENNLQEFKKLANTLIVK
jgi:hypothetical protein